MARDGASAPYLMSDSAKGCPITAYPFSMSIWYYQLASPGTMCLASIGNSGSSSFNGLFTSAGSIRAYIDGSNWIVNTAITGWNHIFWVEVGSTDHKMWINGSLNTNTVSRTVTAGLNRWGVLAFVDSTPASFGVAGQPVADLGVWDVALTSSEATDMYNGRLSPLMIRPQSLVAYAPLNDGDGDARDIIGGRHLIETGGSVALVDNPPMRYPRRSLSGFTPPVATAASSYNSIFHGSVF